MTITERLRFYRRLYDLTQTEVSKILACKREFVSMLENGKSGVTNEYIERCVARVQILGQAKQNIKDKDEFEKVIEKLNKESIEDKKRFDKRYKNGKY